MNSKVVGADQIIATKYRLLDLIGRGGMGSVWRAEHLALKSHVAIKLVEPELLAHPEAMARFLREAQAAASLRSPHVVQILDYGVDEDTPYIVMELLEGESLASRLERLGKLSAKTTAEVISQVSRAVARAHERGIVHRDLKPDNIFITANDDSEIAKVLDFGIAKHTLPGSHGMTQTGAVLGTPYYMSPEQAEGARDVDARSDLWALGVITYECLVGKRPFDEESIGGLILAICARPLPIPSSRAEVPPGFDDWFAHAVCRDRNTRFESARELASHLRQVCGIAETDPGHLSAGTPYPFTSATNKTPAPTPPTTTPTALERAGRTSVGVSLARSIIDEEPIATPMHQMGTPLKAMLASLVLLAAGTGVWLFSSSTSSSNASADNAPTVAGSNPSPPLVPSKAEAIPSKADPVTVATVPSVTLVNPAPNAATPAPNAATPAPNAATPAPNAATPAPNAATPAALTIKPVAPQRPSVTKKPVTAATPTQSDKPVKAAKSAAGATKSAAGAATSTPDRRPAAPVNLGI